MKQIKPKLEIGSYVRSIEQILDDDTMPIDKLEYEREKIHRKIYDAIGLSEDVVESAKLYDERGSFSSELHQLAGEFLIPPTEKEEKKFGQQDLENIDSEPVTRIATVSQKGYPNVTPVWFLREGDTIYVAAEEFELRKVKNLKANDKVALTFDSFDKNNYEKVWGTMIQGRAEEISGEDRNSVIEKFRTKYKKREEVYPFDESYPIYKIAIERVANWGEKNETKEDDIRVPQFGRPQEILPIKKEDEESQIVNIAEYEIPLNLFLEYADIIKLMLKIDPKLKRGVGFVNDELRETNPLLARLESDRLSLHRAMARSISDNKRKRGEFSMHVGYGEWDDFNIELEKMVREQIEPPTEKEESRLVYDLDPKDYEDLMRELQKLPPEDVLAVLEYVQQVPKKISAPMVDARAQTERIPLAELETEEEMVRRILEELE